MGHVHILRDFPSPQEGGTRTVRVYVPDGYDARAAHRYPVLYMHDGQNVFAHPESAHYDTWCANVALEALVGGGHVEPWLVVAVDSGVGRREEYSPWDEPHCGMKARGEAYGRFLVEQLMPHVDATWRTRPGGQWTGIMGSSMGGLISLYLGWRYPEVFGRIGALSPTVMWGQPGLFTHWRRHSRQWTRIYLDAGAHEFVDGDGLALDYGVATPRFHAHLRQLGYADHELLLVLEPDGQHHERDWRRRLPWALHWLLA